MNNLRKKPPPRSSRPTQPVGNTNAGGLYDRDGPIPIPDVEESDTESVWALFEDSRAPSTPRAVVPSDDEPFEETTPAPLKP